MKKVLESPIFKLILSFALLLAGVFLPTDNTFKLVLYLLSYISIGYEVITKAILNIFNGEFLDENFLMTIATLGAIITGEYPEAIMVMWLYEVGEMFQDYATEKSKKSISSLMDLKPDYANIIKGGKIEKVKPEDVKISDVIIVKPGEKIPLDGIIIEGSSQLDTSSLTGESTPISVKENISVLSGSINKASPLKIKVTKEFKDSTVSKILELIENASNKKTKSENFITKFAKIYTPVVVGLALLLAFVPPMFLGSDKLLEYIHRACSFLVISCPCALVISIPLGFFSGIGSASRQGILIKGSNYLEALSKVNTIFFDKTGTLTKGNFEVVKVVPINISEAKLLELAALCEAYSDHPIAISIKKAYAKEIDFAKVLNSNEISGRGISCTVDGEHIYVGNEGLMNDLDITYSKANETGTPIYVATDTNFLGYIVIADELKETTKNTLKVLKETCGVTKIAMLTGDNEKVAASVATALELDEYNAKMLPADKVKKIEEALKNKSNKSLIAFVGDGINDAPSLMRADIGIAMGKNGLDAAIEASDIVIMDDDISKIITAIKISKKTIYIVKGNIAFALLVKLIVLILGSLGIATMWEAVFADVGVSVIAILNSMRCGKFKTSPKNKKA